MAAIASGRGALGDLNEVLGAHFGVTVRRVLPPESTRGANGCLLLPLVRDGERIGTIDVRLDGRAAPDDGVLRLAAAAYVAVLDAERRAALASEREHIARRAQDSVGLQVEALSRRLVAHLAETRERRWRRRLEELLDLSSEASRDARDATRMLAFLDARAGDLVPSLRRLARSFEAETGLTCDVTVEGDPRPAGRPATDALFGLALETLAHADRLGRASTLRVHVEFQPAQVVLRVVDDGVGAANRDPFGTVRRLGERVRQAGGSVAVRSCRPRGLLVEGSMPTRSRH